MPIINLQRKLTEVGRIRLGAKSGKGAPTKLDKFRLTSKSRDALDAAAAVYGGTVQPWNGPDGDAFELITETTVLDVVVPPGNALSQWYEMWTGGGCQRRCDGQTETISNRPCLCPSDQLQRSEMSTRGQACRPTTRLSVLLPKIKSVGLWRLESHGYYAASELAGIAELLQQVSATEKYLPATLRLEQRSAKKNGKTSRFAVPVLEVGATVQEAIEAVAGGAPMKALSSSRPVADMSEPEFDEPAQIEAAPAQPQSQLGKLLDTMDKANEIATIYEQAEKKTEEIDLGWEVDEPKLDPDNPYTIASATDETPIKRKPLNHVQRIQILRRELNLSEEQYRKGLSQFGAKSSKDLTEEQAVEVIRQLSEALARRKGEDNA